MRIYLPNISTNIVRIDESHPDVIVNTRKITEIFSLKGIYECENGKIRKRIIHDIASERAIFNYIDLLIDKSIYKYSNNVLNVDANHYMVTLERLEFNLRRNAKIQLVVEKINSNIKQIYFETNEDIHNYSIAEDFTTLLSLVS